MPPRGTMATMRTLRDVSTDRCPSRRQGASARASGLVALLALPTLLILAGCAVEEPPPPRPKNVVLILLDTLRADHVGAYGYPRETSPFLDQLASEGVLFEQATSAAPATFPSINSLFTSRLPDLFFETNASDLGIPEHLTTLAEVFASQGFRTSAVSASPVVRRSPSFFNQGGGFGQGFETFDESCGYAERHVPDFTAPCVTDRVIAELDTLGQDPFFFYIHYLDPHDPYQPPQASNRFARPYDDKQAVIEGRTWPITQALRGQGEPLEITPRDIQHLVDLYDGEILAVDGELRRLMAAFEEKGLDDDTLFVFVSDHGESFLEHPGILQHGQSVYQTELHVLLMAYWPKGLAADRRSEPVCTIDVFPTVLELTGLAFPDGVQGVSLLSTDGSPRRGRGLCVAAGRPNWRASQAGLLALRKGSDKVIYQRAEASWQMYDLARDPAETVDLAPPPDQSGDERFADLRQTAEAWIEAIAHRADDEPVELDPQAEKALRALGYIQ